MFKISLSDISKILLDYSIGENATGFSELQRYDYDGNNAGSKNVRLIIRVDLEGRSPVVMRFKNENNVNEEIVEAQSRFAETLLSKGIITPHNYCTGGKFAKRYCINGYDVIVTAEDFCENEVRVVDNETACLTGQLLARMHNISEQDELKLGLKTLFDPLDRNDLFDISVFSDNKERLRAIDPFLYDEIEKITDSYLKRVSIFKDERRYAVQGDISLCNLYLTAEGKIGVFDFNNSGDNVLFYDAVMQAVFEATLMDYKDDASADREQEILSAFLNGYNSIRPFTDKQMEALPVFRALITAFENGRMSYHDGNLRELISSNRTEEILACMKTIRSDLVTLKKL